MHDRIMRVMTLATVVTALGLGGLLAEENKAETTKPGSPTLKVPAEKPKAEKQKPVQEKKKPSEEQLEQATPGASRKAVEKEAVKKAPKTESKKAAGQKETAVELPAPILFKNIKCPRGMVGIKATMGRFKKREQSFCIDQFEFPNVEGKFPVTQVTWHQAMQYCKERGKRLCRDHEWLAACGGPEGLKYPYGKEYSPDRCISKKKYLKKVGSAPGCRSPYGVFDMSGNVAEWTSGGGVGSSGGYWKSGKSAQCKEWQPHITEKKYKHVGFRCCLSVE